MNRKRKKPSYPQAQWSRLFWVMSITFACAWIWNLVFGKAPDFKSATAFAFQFVPGGVLGTGMVAKLGDGGVERPLSPMIIRTSIRSGVIGGFVGGVICGILMGLAYYYANVSGWDTSLLRWASLMVVPYVAFIGIVCGIFIPAGMLMGRKFFGWQGELGGAVVGSVAGGALSGVVGGWSFGDLELPMVNGGMVLVATMLGGVFLLMGLLCYGYEGRAKDLLRPMVRAAGIASVIAILLIGFSFLMAGADTVRGLIDGMKSDDLQKRLIAGAVLGGPPPPSRGS